MKRKNSSSKDSIITDITIFRVNTGHINIGIIEIKTGLYKKPGTIIGMHLKPIQT